MHIGTMLKRTANSDLASMRKEQCGYIRPLSHDNTPTTGCQYITGTPTRSELRRLGSDHFKCMAATKDGSPYCEHHHSICYLTVDARSLDAMGKGEK